MTIQYGTKIGRYQILELIGRGGMAEVYKAHDSRLDTTVAIKFIRMERFPQDILRSVVKRFQNEAKRMAQLSNTNIVKVTDYGVYEGIPFLVMEYLPGGTLKQRLGKPVPYQQAARLLLPVAEALAYAHSKGIIHRDVKPGNILLSESRQTMLSDFGVAKIIGREETQGLTATGVSIGTPEYMAPEQAVGEKIDHRVDIYALGIILYELITGHRPFTADTPMKVVVKQINEPPPNPSRFVKGLPAEVERVLIKALAKNPDNRFVDMDEFVEALEDLAAGVSIQDGIKKTRFPSWIWLAGFLTLSLIAVIWLFGLRKPIAVKENTLTQATEDNGGMNGNAEVHDSGYFQALCDSDAYGCVKIEPGQTIKIGVSSPMTGGDSGFGIDAENSGLLAVADAGDFEGFSFELVAEDDEGSPEGGAAVANKLVADPTFVAMAGPLFSGATAAAIPIYDETGIPMLSPSATNPDLTKLGSAVFNRIPFTDEAQGSAAADFIFNKLGFRTISVLYSDDDYGKNLAASVKDTFETFGGEIVAFGDITPSETENRFMLTSIARKTPELLYYGGYSQGGAMIVNLMKSTGLEDAVFFGCDGTYGNDFMNRVGENAEGTYHAIPRIPSHSEAKEKFDADYLNAYGVSPGMLSPFSWNNYDSAMALISKVKEVGVLGEDGALYIPRGALVTAVRNLKNYTGISGIYSCDEVGECNVEGPQFMKVINGAFVSVD